MNIKIATNSDTAFALTAQFCWQEDLASKKLPGFFGNLCETLLLLHQNQPTLYIGLGSKQKQDKLADSSVQMELFSTLSSTCKKLEFYSASADVAPLLTNIAESDLAQNAALGLVLGTYTYQPEDTKYTFDLHGFSAPQPKAFTSGTALGKAVIEARRLVDCPSNQLRPLDFADRLSQWLQPLGVECNILQQNQLEEIGMGGLLGIGQSAGDTAPPCLCVLRYKTDSSLPHTGLVGKGVTFDSGGTCLKPAGSMGGAKGDMAGGAAVAATLYALASNKVAANVTAVIPMCENRLAHNSLVPGDVYRSYSGKTVEVLNTDAEGRLILADAVSYAIKVEKCERIIDVATLTGAVVNTLGFTVAGAVTNSDSLWREFSAAATQAGEKYWLLPAFEEHHKMLESDFADLKNLGEKHCGTITGGLFIGAFAEDTPWLHLDIAGTASVDRPYTAYQAKGATGAGVTSLYRFILNAGRN